MILLNCAFHKIQVLELVNNAIFYSEYKLVFKEDCKKWRKKSNFRNDYEEICQCVLIDYFRISNIENTSLKI